MPPLSTFMHFDTACIFIDGENLRHSLVDLFDSEFNPTDYLPKTAHWDQFFDSLTKQADAEHRLRTYWYVVDELDCWPYGLQRLVARDYVTKQLREPATLQSVMRKFKPYCKELDTITDNPKRLARAEEMANQLIQREIQIRRRFEGWKVLQNGIAQKFDSVEFRRAGSIWYNLFTQSFGQEKGVDVKLATDILKLNEIYDVGIVVSGDGDYVPAVEVVKDWGKHIINVSFLKKSGGLLPGGARRLNQATDRAIEVSYSDMKKFMNLSVRKATAAAVGQAALTMTGP